MKSAIATFIVVCLAALACGDKVTTTPNEAAAFQWPDEAGKTAVLTIRNMGTVEIALYPSLAPKTVEHVAKLARDGVYDGTTFHRVIPGFMIQGGDPNSKDDEPANDGHGRGHTVEDEFNDAPHERGVLSMANRGKPNTGGAQFFIVHQDAKHLDGKHTVLGRVISGMEVVDAITTVETDRYGRWGPENRPIENVVVEKFEIR